jgi:hypothetical protein
MWKEHSSGKRNQQPPEGSGKGSMNPKKQPDQRQKNQQGPMSEHGGKDKKYSYGGEQQNSQNKNQHGANQHRGSYENWKNQKDESEIETPGKMNEGDDGNNTGKKIPQMNKLQDNSKY